MYNFLKIEKKWQEYWDKNKSFKAYNNSDKEKYYVLIEFPYPSGSGLHIGHPRSYTALDVVARKRRMEGYNVLFPIGWDAFGLPAENYAIANKIHPRDAVKENMKVFKKQMKMIGFSFDWDREFATTDPEYMKWTQWQFLKFYEHDLAYKAKKLINWCTSCKVGLANEEVESGKCERCGGEVVRKEKAQWVLKMKSYADKLIEGLNDTDFVEKVKTAQINWIGKSEGAEIDFGITNSDEMLKVYTTRPDTIFGATFMVVSPEHPILNKIKFLINNFNEVEIYQKQALLKSEFERVEINKEKTGVRLEGVKAINPLNNAEIEIWVADYVMMGYGTGAIMGVPAHDDRDYEFAKKFNIPIIEVIKGGNILEAPYIGDGEMINSDFLNGINNKEAAITKIINFLEEKGIGKQRIEYRLQDWIFSRQRFWGEPIPMIYCEKCGWVPVPEKDLPVLLPDVASYEPTEDGESPLANIPEWYTTTCPKCGMKARRETDTMPNWAGSSWYWLRYMDPHNDQAFVGEEALKYWGKVDWYNGGMEHATRHLLYARFWHRFLYDIGLVPTKEPFQKRTAHGMVLGENNEKMSKSKGNVINPNDIVMEYGADALRTYEMFMGDYETETAWSNNGLKGCKRFLDRVWRIKDKVNNNEKYTKELEIIINQTIKKVSNDIENMKFNTAISSLMILLNEYEKLETISKADLRIFLLLLNPFAPHITEEINDLKQLGKPLHKSKWVQYDKDKITNDTFELVVQVNGKVRGRMTITNDLSEEEIKTMAMEHENVQKHIIDKKIIKVIAIPQKLINIVVK
jgi:leucyl-tRNA synthetase